jgi:hypothetical protein
MKYFTTNRTALMAFGALVTLAGCGSNGGGGGAMIPPAGASSTGTADSSAPVISGASATSSNMRYVGGAVPVSATITDNVGVASAEAVVEVPAGEAARPAVPLTAGANGLYSGTFAAPANVTASGQAATYRLTVRARDAAGNVVASSPLAVTVPAPVPPPALGGN